MTSDAAVAGGGIIGMAVALRLARAGLRVALFDRHRTGSEASAAAAGLLAAQCLTDPPGPEDGGMEEAFFQTSLEARAMYPEFLAEVASRSHRDTAWHTRGNLCVAAAPAHAAVLEERVSRHRARGLRAELLGPAEITALEPSIRGARGALFPEDGVVDNQALMPALREAVLAAGVTLHEEDPVVGVLTEAGRAAGVRTRRESHAAGVVVLAVGAWSDELLPPGEPRASVRPARGQIVVLEAGATGPDLPVIGEHMYIVPRAAGRMLLGSTVEDAGFDRNPTAGGVRTILDGVAEFCPGIASWGWVTAWAGLRPRPGDDWPVVGPAVGTSGLWIAGGHYRNGILWAPLTAAWILAGIRGEALPEAAAWFAPSRFAEPARRG